MPDYPSINLDFEILNKKKTKADHSNNILTFKILNKNFNSIHLADVKRTSPRLSRPFPGFPDFKTQGKTWQRKLDRLITRYMLASNSSTCFLPISFTLFTSCYCFNTFTAILDLLTLRNR